MKQLSDVNLIRTKEKVLKVYLGELLEYPKETIAEDISDLLIKNQLETIKKRTADTMMNELMLNTKN